MTEGRIVGNRDGFRVVVGKADTTGGNGKVGESVLEVGLEEGTELGELIGCVEGWLEGRLAGCLVG